jgi:hypothetical protein
MDFLPYAEMLLRQLAVETLVVVMDGRGVGRDCSALMIHGIYKGRALPLAWRVRQCPKGHGPEELHMALVELGSDLVPPGRRWSSWAMVSLMAWIFRRRGMRRAGSRRAARPRARKGSISRFLRLTFLSSQPRKHLVEGAVVLRTA